MLEGFRINSIINIRMNNGNDCGNIIPIQIHIIK